MLNDLERQLEIDRTGHLLVGHQFQNCMLLCLAAFVRGKNPHQLRHNAYELSDSDHQQVLQFVPHPPAH